MNESTSTAVEHPVPTTARAPTRRSRRSFGSILPPDPSRRRRSFSVHFVWKGKRVVRRAGMRRSDASAKLAAAEALLKQGTDLAIVLAEVFGDDHGSLLTFRDAIPKYLAYAATRKKESTLQ